ncbi:dihydrodipicolinate reductase [Salibaculum griseiflavum]|uniref:Dihydrodipicolinate reductase n=1 Tax=Salibaculum griseiflavum TaxID=1914409 RepID=A0A2V1P4R1_9RHOB|nr:dihydrodipicolinate reductase [Salibaculum griseiflavum]PWG16292.1 dihydrodipicolinate reductase [Salibaculum griseiflavum]
MKRVFLITLGLALLAGPAMAFDRVDERDRFVSLIDGRDLRLGLFGITLQVSPDGTINGSAQGWDVTGTWDWRDGYFCREMDWSGTPISYDCQLVEERGGEKLRFTVNRGEGMGATFNLR